MCAAAGHRIVGRPWLLRACMQVGVDNLFFHIPLCLSQVPIVPLNFAYYSAIVPCWNSKTFICNYTVTCVTEVQLLSSSDEFCFVENELCKMEKTRSAVADEGWTSNKSLYQASNFVTWLFHQLWSLEQYLQQFPGVTHLLVCDKLWVNSSQRVDISFGVGLISCSWVGSQ